MQLLYLDPHVTQNTINIDSPKRPSSELESEEFIQNSPTNSSLINVSSSSIVDDCNLPSSENYLSTTINKDEQDGDFSGTRSIESLNSNMSSKNTKSVQNKFEMESTIVVGAEEFILPSLKPYSPKIENVKNDEKYFDDSTYHCPYLLSMDFDSLDPSLALAFVCVCEDDYVDLVERLNNSVINVSNPPLFDVLENRPKGWPKFVPYVMGGDDDLIKLKGIKILNESICVLEYDDFGDSQFDSDEQFEILE